MSQLLLLLILISTITWYFWRKYSPYLSFHNYFFCNWHVIATFLRGKGPRNEPVSVYLLQLLKETCKKHFADGLIAMWFPEPVIVVYGPEAVKFFANEGSLFDKPWPYQYLDVFGENGLVRSGGKRAKKLRKLMCPAFYPSMMKNYFAAMNDHALYFVHELEQLENQTAKDIGKIIKARTMKLFCEAALGIKIGSVEEDRRIEDFIKPFTKALEFVVYRIYRPWLHFDFMLHVFSKGRMYMKYVKDVQFVVKQIVEEMKQSYDLRIRSNDHNKTDPNLHDHHKRCFGDVLLEEQSKDPTYTTKDLEGDITTLIAGGFDTASGTVMWTLWLLGFHDEIQEKAYEEITTISGDVLDYEVFRNLTYLECIIKESLRMYTILPMTGRVSKKDLYFGKCKIPSGTKIIFATAITHKNPKIYPEPEVFNPDRFLGNDSEIKPWNFLPFAESVRSCIGKNYAMLEMKVFLAHVIRNFKMVSLTPVKDVRLRWELVLNSTKPLSVKFIPR